MGAIQEVRALSELGKISLTLGRKKSDGDFGNYEVIISEERRYNSIAERDEAIEEIKRNSKVQMDLILNPKKGNINA